MRIQRTINLVIISCLLWTTCHSSLHAQQAANAQQDPRMVRLQQAYQQAQALWQQGKYKEAEPLYAETLQLARQVLGPKAKATGVLAFNVAANYMKVGRNDQAIKLFRESLKISESILEPKEKSANPSFEQLAKLLARTGKFDAGEKLLIDAIANHQQKLGPDHYSVATLQFYLGDFYMLNGRITKAEKVVRQSLESRERINGLAHPSVIVSTRQLGELYLLMNRPDLAQEPLERAYKGIVKTWGAKNYSAGTAASLVGVVYRQLGKYDEAEKYFLASVSILDKAPYPHRTNLLEPLNHLGILYTSQKKWDSAEKYLTRSVAFIEKHLGPVHPNLAMVLANLATVYNAREKYDLAEQVARRSIAIHQKLGGKDPGAIAHAKFKLADTLLHRGKSSEGEQLLKEALATIESLEGPDNPAAVIIRQVLAASQWKYGDKNEAIGSFDDALRRAHRYAFRVLPVMSQQDQIDYVNNKFQETLHVALWVGFMHRKNPDSAQKSAEWLINGKAITAPILSKRVSTIRKAHHDDPQIAVAAEELRRLRVMIARLTKGGINPNLTGRQYGQLLKMQTREKQLVRSIGIQAGKISQDDTWVTIKQVRRKIPTGSVLIEFAQMKRLDGSAFHYVAWVIPSVASQPVRIVDLGPAKPTNDAIAKFRAGLYSGLRRQSDRRAEQAAERSVYQNLESVADRILKPLMPFIGRYPRWIISPDSDLWLVPWSALPIGQRKYAVERYTIQCVVTSRNLVNAFAPIQTNAPLIVFDPDYGAGGSGVFSPLPGTKTEGTSILPLLTRYSKQTPKSLTRGQALEATVKNYKNPMLLILSTHGYYDPSPFGRSAVKNPLLNCGLALAGANNPRTASDGNDGILTGMEVLAMDLRGTELVVLSACQTGLGKVNLGEGVSGLRQSFQLAGAQSILATLWSIPDQETAVLMTEFFKSLNTGKDHASALRFAQMALINQRRRSQGAAHPVYWAAFTMTGPPNKRRAP